MPVDMGSDAGWEADRVAQALRNHVLPADAPITKRTDWPDEVILRTPDRSVVGSRAAWFVGREPWVRFAVRAVEDQAYITNTSVTHGFVFVQGSDDVLYLNDVATMRDLGGRVGQNLDPIAYAELLAELYSGPSIDGPSVRPTSITPEHPAGELVRNVKHFHHTYAFVDSALLAEPTVQMVGARLLLEFVSGHYYLTDFRAMDLLRWRVTCGGGRPASWEREYVARRLESP